MSSFWLIILSTTNANYLRSLSGRKDMQQDRGSNPGPVAYKAIALPTKLSRRYTSNLSESDCR